jgi:hypothetical protein
MTRSRRGGGAFVGVVCAAIGAMALSSPSGAARPGAAFDLTGARLQTIERIARFYASKMGDSHPLGALIIASYRQRANRLTNGDLVNSNEPVYVVQISGQFIDYLAAVPPGQPFPRGNTIELIMGRGSFRITDDSVGNTKSISHLGHPEVLPLG